MRYSAGDASRAATSLQSDPHLPKQGGECRPASFSLPRDRRLRKASDFQAIRTSGKSWANPLLVLRYRPNGLDITRLGFSVGKRVGNAVVRNKVKRRLREFTRQSPLASGRDILFIARPPVAQASYQQLTQAARDLMSRAGLMKPQEAGDKGK